METTEQAHAYAVADFSQSNDSFILNLFESYQVKEHTKILDVGCGDGEIPIKIYNKVKCKISAIDGSQSMLDEFSRKLNKNNIDNIEVFHQRFENNTFDNNSFDVVISNSVLHHVRSPQEFWNNVIMLTKSGGCIFLMDLIRPSNENELSQILEKYGGNDPVLLNDFENSLRAAYTIDEVINHLSIHSLARSSVKAISDRHFFVNIQLKE